MIKLLIVPKMYGGWEGVEYTPYTDANGKRDAKSMDHADYTGAWWEVEPSFNQNSTQDKIKSTVARGSSIMIPLSSIVGTTLEAVKQKCETKDGFANFAAILTIDGVSDDDYVKSQVKSLLFDVYGTVEHFVDFSKIPVDEALTISSIEQNSVPFGNSPKGLCK